MASRSGRSLKGGRVNLKTPIDFGIRVGTKGRKVHARGPRGRHAGQRKG